MAFRKEKKEFTLSKYIKEGDKLDIETIQRPGKESEKRQYRSMVYDIVSEDQIKIAADVLGPEGCKSEIVYRPDKPNGRDFVQDISKNIAELGYKPVYDYRSYMEDYKKEMEQNRFHGLFTPRSEE